MMIKTYGLSIFFALFFFSCKPAKELTKELEKETYEINYTEKVNINSNFSLSILNHSNDSIIILNPYIKNFEKFENSAWRKVRILHCPCNANCVKPPSKITIGKGQDYKVIWNLMEGWCGEKDKYGIKPTIENILEEGIYRIKFEIIFKGNEKVLYKEFKILQ